MSESKDLDSIDFGRLIHEHEGELVTTSKDVATVFRARHDNLMRAIRNLSSEKGFKEVNFQATELPDSYGRMQDAYYLTRDGALLLIFRFKGERAERITQRYMQAFNAMAAKLRSPQQEEMSVTLDLCLEQRFEMLERLKTVAIEWDLEGELGVRQLAKDVLLGYHDQIEPPQPKRRIRKRKQVTH